MDVTPCSPVEVAKEGAVCVGYHVRFTLLYFATQGVYSETPWFIRCFKNMRIFLGVKDLLPSTVVEIPSLIFRLPREPPLGRTTGVPV
jgi:hypothetical protein